MLFRLISSAALIAVGYYIGYQIGKTEHIRQELEASRQDVDENEPDLTNNDDEKAQ
ncbi:MAG: hypothetical protein PVG75_12700 [Thioalkalispiraceae bacterium]|jgi:hypothetical protein